MAARDRATLKTFFETGDVPTQVQFADLIDSFELLNSALSQIAVLADPGADRLLFWDDSVNAYVYLALGTNLSITGTTLNAVGGGGGNAQTADPLSQFASTTSAQLAGVISDETGTGALVFATSPTLVTPILGTPTTLVGTNITGTASGLTAGNVTINANLTGHVTSTGNAAVLGSFTKAQLDTAVSDGNVLYVGDAPTSDPTGVTGADAITNMMSLTQAEFDAIGSPSTTTFYLITDAV